MANSDKNILITPNTGSSTLSPTIVFRGANNTPVTLRTLDTGTISFEGTAGQLFSISDGLSGSIFSVNDISGIPSIEVLDTGLIKLNQYSGSTAFGSSAAIQNSSSVNAKVSISTVFPATPGLIIKGAASQTADLQQWQNSSGTVLAKIKVAGDLLVPTVQDTTSVGPYLQFGANDIFIINTGTAKTNLKIRAIASQTANLTEWQDINNTVLTKVESSGAVNISPTSTPNGYSLYVIGAGSSGIVTMKSTATSAHAIQLQNSANTVVFKMDLEGRIVPSSASSTGLVVRSVASQAGNMQEWQNSSGAILAAIGPNGTFYMGSNGGANIANFYSNTDGYGVGNISAQGTFNINGANMGYPYTASGATLSVNTQSANQIGLTVRGYASQAYNLQEWQNSSGTILTKVGAGGVIDTTVQLSARSALTAGTDNYLSASLSVIPLNASVVGQVIRGFASQTADLQQWQNSAGTNLVRISSSGKTLIASDGENPSSMLTISQAAQSAVVTSIASTSSDYGLTLNATGSGNNTTVGMAFSAFASTGFNGTSTPGGAIWFTRTGSYSLGYLSFLTRSSTGANDPLVERMRVGDTGTISIAGFAAGSPGLVVKAAASQTANLQEWCNNSGTVISSISSYGGGRLYDLGIKGAPAGIAWAYFGNDSISTKNVVVRAVASQTANLQEWQDSAGTVMLNVSSSGNLSSNSSLAQAARFRYFDNPDTNSSFIDTQTTMTVIGRSPTTTTLVVRSAASQTANLQDWNSSSGTVLTYISSTGKLTSAVDASINGVVIGMGAGSASTNTVVGLNSLVSNTTGTYNTAFGNQSLQLNTSGTQNTAFGQAALYNNRSGWYNTAFGQGALQNNNYAYSNTAIGANAMVTNVSGSGNTAVGIQSLLLNLSGSSNVGFGSNAGFSNSTGSGNIFLGTESGYYETGSNKLYIANTNTTTPLIGGDFSAKTLTIAGNATITSQATGTVGLIVKAIASQTADLQQWQDSAGTVFAKITADGTTTLASGGVDIRGGSSNFTIRNSGTTAYFVNASLLVGTGYSAGIGVIIRGNGSQTANLQEWQNSAGTVLASVNNAGRVNASTIGTLNNWVFNKEESSGGQIRLKKSTATPTEFRASDFGQIYLRDGTNAGTLKLVIVAGASGAETTILDNIPQS